MLRHGLVLSTALTAALFAIEAQAWSLSIASAPRRVFLHVGNGTIDGNNSLVNRVDGGGCTATLTSGQAFPLTAANCQAFAAKAGSTTVAQGGAFSGTFTSPVVMTLGAVGGLAVLREATKSDKQPTIVLPISPI